MLGGNSVPDWGRSHYIERGGCNRVRPLDGLPIGGDDGKWDGTGVLLWTFETQCRLKEFNEISGRVYQQDLRSARSRDDVIAELDAGGAQACRFRRQVVDDEMYTIPTAGSGLCAVRHRSCRRTRRSAEQQSQRSAPHIRESGGVV